MSTTTILTIILVAFTIVVLVACTYVYLRDRTLDDVREDAYKLFLQAEHDSRFKTGKKRMVWVLSEVVKLLPAWLRLLITDKFLEDLVEKWFQGIKDLLDDGKMNGSGKEDEEND